MNTSLSRILIRRRHQLRFEIQSRSSVNVSIDLESIRKAYIAERPSYQRLGERVTGTLRSATRKRGIESHIDFRTKDVASFVKKCLRKPYTDPLNQIRDKAGVRV